MRLISKACGYPVALYKLPFGKFLVKVNRERFVFSDKVKAETYLDASIDAFAAALDLIK